ncbi:FxDxF family PEP-CTERM protein [Aquabacterium sp. OR-4]|uniref:FxDxF family PEP-CTERM protein n=1 Tax=Aquabacterium sp. OR-4 TaxID=2978127 RepID=UPI0021B29C89|nr:FxDxF family PEP-CTERM protein [Aquabacterium sp. OR-4]MDT7835944.1 FxDxF family PEP-CTERM protein [Aquabacterium sp. OR-4]
MKLKSIVAAATLVLAGTSSFAATMPLGTLTEDASLIGGSGTGLFTLNYSFSLASLSDVLGGISSFTPNVSTAATISDGSVTWTDGNAADGFSFAGLAAGSYTLTISAFSAVKAPIGGYISASPVPEPETYAMMLAGLGAVGFLASRRRG